VFPHFFRFRGRGFAFCLALQKFAQPSFASYFFCGEAEVGSAGNFWGQTGTLSQKPLGLAMSRTCLHVVWETLFERSFLKVSVFFKMYHLKQSFFFRETVLELSKTFVSKFSKGLEENV